MKRRDRILKAALALIGLALLATSMLPQGSASAAQVTNICTDEIKVMPLGDSITTGKYSGPNTQSPSGDFDDIGYREDLYNMLIESNFNVDFVGTKSNGEFADPDHEGHNGWTDTQIAANIYGHGGENWLNLYPPDVILLHIGTNELSNDPTQVEIILNKIDDYESDSGRRVIVILARIINMVPTNSVVTDFNDTVELMVKNRAEFGLDLFLVDMEDGAGLNYSIWPGDLSGDMIDNLHPYASGYTKMAQVWMDAFDNLCKKVYLPMVYKNFSAKNYLWE